MKMYRKCEMIDGTIKWYLVTKKGSILHKMDGPAVQRPNNDNEWWYENTKIDCKSQEEFQQYLRLKSFW